MADYKSAGHSGKLNLGASAVKDSDKIPTERNMSHRFIPITDTDRVEMLQRIGVNSLDELFSDIPQAARNPQIQLPSALSEMDMLRTLRGIASKNANAGEYAYFLGAGAYNHFIPATVPHLIFRSEFFTAYTPYQPEISQGTLQTIFEYQSMICDL